MLVYTYIKRPVPPSLEFTITESSELPIEIFLFRINPDGSSTYMTVCELSDLLTYQTDASIGVPFYRAASMTMTVSNLAELEAKFVIVTDQIKTLENVYKRYLVEGHFGETVTVTIDDYDLG
jgi:hypothetical protein